MNCASPARNERLAAENFGGWFYPQSDIFSYFLQEESHMISLTIAGILILCGISIRFFKQYWLIAGYNTASPEEKKKIDTTRLGKIVSNLCFIIAIILLVSSYFDFQDNTFKLTQQDLKIPGFFGTTVHLSDIKGVSLKKEIPEIETKNFGADADTWTANKGSFTLKRLGTGNIYVFPNKPPYLYISTSKSYVIINFKDSNKTKELFNTLQGKVKKKN